MGGRVEKQSASLPSFLPRPFGVAEMLNGGGHAAIEQFYCGRRRRNPFGVCLDPQSHEARVETERGTREEEEGQSSRGTTTKT